MSVDFNIGEVVPGTHYRVVLRIGQGGMGSVYEVEHVELGKRFVLKALLPQFLERKDLVQRLRNEWRSLGKLEHPNIVSVSDAGVAKNGVPFYVMERLQGETLAAALKKRGRLPLVEALRIACEILEGLSAAHEIGVVHRDIKPPNIFLTQGGAAKVLDFGIAKLTDGASLELTGRGIAIGTPRYMSPEQAAGEAVDGRADLYAVGLLLFEMIAGAGPFDGGDQNEVFLAHLTRQPPRLATFAPGIPAELDGLTAKLLAKHPHERPATAGAAARALRGILRVTPQLRPDTVASPMSGALTPVLPAPSSTVDQQLGARHFGAPAQSPAGAPQQPRVGAPYPAHAPAAQAQPNRAAGSAPPAVGSPLAGRIVRSLPKPSLYPPAMQPQPAPRLSNAPSRPAGPRTPAPLGGYPADLTTQAVVAAAPLSLSQQATFNDAPPTRTAVPAASTPPPVSNSSRPPAWGSASMPAPPRHSPSRTRWVALSALSAGFASVVLVAVWLTQRADAVQSAAAALPAAEVARQPSELGAVSPVPAAVLPAGLQQQPGVPQVIAVQAHASPVQGGIATAVSGNGNRVETSAGSAEGSTAAKRTANKARQARSSVNGSADTTAAEVVPAAAPDEAEALPSAPSIDAPSTIGNPNRGTSRGIENAGRRLPGPGIPLN
jgi:eukaryotic-like serine/threonine-protein kinase